MSIEEKKRPLEFGYTDESVNNLQYNITCYSDDRTQPIVVTCGETEMRYSTKFFEDVFEFLLKKGVVNKSVAIRHLSPSIGGSLVNKPEVSSLPIPQVEGKSEESIAPPSDPLSSFDIGNVPTAGNSSKEGSELSSTKVVTASEPTEEINRPVIRTRVNDSDPMSAEKEGAAIRGKGKSGESRSIKKKHEIQE